MPLKAAYQSKLKAAFSLPNNRKKTPYGGLHKYFHKGGSNVKKQKFKRRKQHETPI